MIAWPQASATWVLACVFTIPDFIKLTIKVRQIFLYRLLAASRRIISKLRPHEAEMPPDLPPTAFFIYPYF